MASKANEKGHLEVKTVLQRAEKAWTAKRRWMPLLREVYEFALPQRNPYHSGDGTEPGQSAGQKKTDRLFDSTLVNAAHKLANRIQADLTPPFTSWGKLVPGPVIADPAAQEQISRELGPINNQLFTILSVSNFDVTSAEFYLDFVVSGLGVLGIVDNRNGDGSPVNFVAIPQAEVAIEEGPWGAIWGMYRRHSIPRMMLKAHWPDAELPERPANAKEKWDTEDVRVTEAHYWSPDAGKWLYEVLIEDGSGKTKADKRIVARQYATARWIAARWSKVAGEAQGRSPAMLALADAKTLNLVKELVLRNASLAVAGLWLVKHTNVVAPGKIPIRPGVQIPVHSTGGTTGASVVPLQRPDGFDVAQLVINDLAQSINQIMLNKGLPPEAGPVRSPTEIIERIKELQQDLGAPFGRLLSEFIRPLLTSVLGVLHDIGLVRVAQNAIKVDGAFVDVQVQSPMATSQDLVEIEAVVNWLTILKGMGQEIFMLSAVVEDAGAWLGRKMGVPLELVRPKEQRSQLEGMAGKLLGMQQTGGVPIGGGGQTIPANSGAGQTPARLAA